MMNIVYFTPLAKGWERMKRALFRPFNPSKWFAVGFTVFLAGLTDCHGGGGGGRGGRGHRDWEDVLLFPQRAWEWLLSHPQWMLLIILGITIIVVLVVVFTWLSSRGRFMFLDNVVHDRALVVKPWYEYRTEGNSLFLWRVTFGFCVFALIMLYLIYCFTILYGLYTTTTGPGLLLGPVILMGLGFLGFILLVSFVELLLTDFVVPIMYRSRIGVLKGWRQFLTLFFDHIAYFIGYGLLMLILGIAIVIAIIFAGLLTCCLGFLLLMIPYINAVILLPISYTFRAFSVEVLEQFGPEYYIFPRPESEQPVGA